MKNQSVFYSLTRVAIILTAAFFFAAQADDKKTEKDPSAGKFRAAEEKIWSAVKAGKLSKEAAQKKLAGLKKQIWGENPKKDSGDKKESYDKREAKFNSFEKEIRSAVKAGKLTKETAQKKLAGLKKEIWGGDLKKNSGDKKKGYDKGEAKFNAFENEIWSAVKAGKLSKRDAIQKLEGLKKEMFGDQGKKDWDGKKNSGDEKRGYDKRETKFNAFEKEIWGAVKAGKLSKEDAMKKLEGLKKEVFDEHEKKGRSGKKGQAGKPASDVEALKRQLGALKRENEGLRKRLEGRKER
jgi:hypothetical protein